MKQKILIFVSRILCYESNYFFIAQIEKEFLDMGYEVELCEIDESNEKMEEQLEKYIGKKFEAIIDFNSRMQRIEMDTGERYLNQIDAPFYNYIVDHPLYHHPVIKIDLQRSNIICIDRKHQEYIKTYYPNVQKVIFMPLGAMEALNNIPYEKRRHDVLFLGTYLSSNELLQEINQATNKEQIHLLIKVLINNPNKTQEQALQEILEQSENKLSKKEFAEQLNACYLADKFLKSYYREKLIESILQEKITVTVCGHGWENFVCENPEYLIRKDSVTFPVSLEMMADSRIVLNINPWFKDGVHDRVLTAMANKAVCITDTSIYLEEKFIGDKHLVFYSLEHLEAVGSKIKSLLENDKKAKEISECGYHIVKSEHMWKNRIRENKWSTKE